MNTQNNTTIKFNNGVWKLFSNSSYSDINVFDSFQDVMYAWENLKD